MVEMKMSNRVDVYNLRYTKLINTVSNIGGMVKLITMIGTTLTFFYSRNKYDFDLVNQLFYISKISYQKSNCKVVHSFTKECSITNSNASIVGGFDLIKIKTKSNKTLNLKLNNKIQNIVMIKRSNIVKEEIDANLRHLFCYNLHCKDETTHLLHKGINLIKKNLDIINCFNENVNMNLIKQLLLTKEQLSFFNSSYKYYLGDMGNTTKENYVFKNSNGGIFTNKSVVEALSLNINQLYFN